MRPLFSHINYVDKLLNAEYKHSYVQNENK